jgi:hypothetical protein
LLVLVLLGADEERYYLPLLILADDSLNGHACWGRVLLAVGLSVCGVHDACH